MVNGNRDFLSSAMVQNAMQELSVRCREDWTHIGPAHILLTGGTGFFGSWVIASFAALRQAGFPMRLTVMSRNPQSFLAMNPSLSQIDGLVFEKADVVSATIPSDVTHVFHFATTPTQKDDPESQAEMRSTIVAGTKRMLDEAVRVCANRFLLASSGAVYGKGKSDGPEESSALASGFAPLFEHPTSGLTSYGAAKREAERLCFEIEKTRALETVVARGFAFSGPLFPLKGPYAISGFMTAMLNGSPLNVKAPETVRSYLDGRDLAYTLWLLMARGRRGEAYNVGGTESVTMRELADLVRATAIKVGRRIPDVHLVVPTGARTGMMQSPDIYRPSLKKLQSEFGWKPDFTLKESLRDHALWATE